MLQTLFRFIGNKSYTLINQQCILKNLQSKGGHLLLNNIKIKIVTRKKNYNCLNSNGSQNKFCCYKIKNYV